MRKKHENRRLILEGNFYSFYFRNLKHQLYLTELSIVFLFDKNFNVFDQVHLKF